VFFSLSDSKLIPYILPAMPALALAIASLPEGFLRRDLSRTALGTVGLALGLALVCLFAPAHVAPTERNGYFLALRGPLAEVAALLAVSGLYVLSRRRREATGGALFLGPAGAWPACSRCARRGGRAHLFGRHAGAGISRDTARGSPLQRGDV